jgi:DNA-binding NarL/FixJ family response regulator
VIQQRVERAGANQTATVQTLVISQHDAVRRLLVAYLGRSPDLVVQGEPFAPETILQTRPDVLVLDLSQLGRAGLRAAIDAAQRIGAHLIALASMRDADDEQTVLGAGGMYRLKSAGADGLAETVRAVASRPAASP